MDKLEKAIIKAIKEMQTGSIAIKGHTIRVVKREFRKFKSK